jgi:Methyltransferase domain
MGEVYRARDTRLDRTVGFGDALPFADASFDRVFSSMMFDHLPHNVKREMLGTRDSWQIRRPFLDTSRSIRPQQVA